MKALVYHGPGQRAGTPSMIRRSSVPTDVIVRIDTTTICGTDLHILKGDVPETTPGTILGHEAVGTVQEVGAGVTTVAPGDRVLMSCVSAAVAAATARRGATDSASAAADGSSATSSTGAGRVRPRPLRR